MTTVNLIGVRDYHSGTISRGNISFDFYINDHGALIVIPVYLMNEDVIRFVEGKDSDKDISTYGNKNLYILDDYPRLDSLYKHHSKIIYQIFSNARIIQHIFSDEVSKQINFKLNQLYLDLKEDKVKEEY